MDKMDFLKFILFLLLHKCCGKYLLTKGSEHTCQILNFLFGQGVIITFLNGQMDTLIL